MQRKYTRCFRIYHESTWFIERNDLRKELTWQINSGLFEGNECTNAIDKINYYTYCFIPFQLQIYYNAANKKKFH